MQRRAFLATTVARSIWADAPPRVGVIGAGGRGRYLIEQFREVGAGIIAVCDVYEPNLRRGLTAASTSAKSFTDYRSLLDDKSIEAVIIATPDHWHARMAIDAVLAGKDVYVEKPLAHNIEDGFAIVDAVRHSRRIVQVGTQRRSAELFQRAHQLASASELGDVRLVTSIWLSHQAGLNSQPLDGALDWKQWLGPAPARLLDPVRFFNWYYFWDYSGGLLVGQAAHIVDAIHWYMGSREPLAVACTGGRVNLERAEIPETASLSIEYPENYLAVFTIGYKAMRYHPFNDQLLQFHGSKARLDIGRESYALFRQSDSVELKPALETKQPGSFASATRSHIRNFLECVQSREEPSAPVEAGQSTNIVLCMALESLRTGRRLRWNSATRRVET